ncbi:hypothetical protein N9109_00790 [bacterium]|nr:hypothetical protein [bacterium]
MKITLDLPSVLTGGTVALVLGLVAGFTPQVTQLPGATNIAPRQITGQFSPHPSDLVCLESFNDGNSSGYDSPTITVPAGRILVLTGFTGGATFYLSSARIDIDGVTRDFYYGSGSDYKNTSMIFAGGVPLVEGQTLQLKKTGQAYGHTWLHGYWADA